MSEPRTGVGSDHRVVERSPPRSLRQNPRDSVSFRAGPEGLAPSVQSWFEEDTQAPSHAEPLAPLDVGPLNVPLT